MWGTIGKNLKKIIITFQKKKGQLFFQIFPNGPPLWNFYSPKVSRKNWPNYHSGQSVTGQTVTLARMSLAKVSPAKVTLAKLSLWPKCPGQSVAGQSVFLAKV